VRPRLVGRPSISAGPGGRLPSVANVVVQPLLPCPGRLGCGWTQHGRKHFPHPGLTREHTTHGYPAKYLPGSTPEQIQGIETSTVLAPARALSIPPGKAEYVREIDHVIGWDRGKDATISFVECSGGATAGRSYHGRPMAPDNVRLRGAAT
jgi:hypothetical protein